MTKMSNTIEDEIDAIRDQIYEVIKGMSPSEETEYFRRETEAVIKQYGFRTEKSADGPQFSVNQHRRHTAPDPHP
jgi:hypothetical protein